MSSQKLRTHTRRRQSETIRAWNETTNELNRGGKFMQHMSIERIKLDVMAAASPEIRKEKNFH